MTGRHFLARRDGDSDCKVCSHHKRKRTKEAEDEKEKKRPNTDEVKEPETEKTDDVTRVPSPAGKKEERQSDSELTCNRVMTFFYCKTCSGEPSLCPVPCFELYHTRLIYKTVPKLEAQGEPSTTGH